MAVEPDVAAVTRGSERCLERYLERLRVEPRPPSLGALTELHRAHLEHVAFENLDIVRGVPIRLDEAALIEKILRGRGGFCYELNGAFAWLTRRLGYDVTLVEGRVARGDGGFGIRFDHLALVVRLDRPYLADVGFGAGFVEPLALVEESIAVQGTDAYRISPLPSGLLLEHRPGRGSWTPEYRFTLEPRELADFEPACRHHQSSPESHFTKGPLVTRLAPGGRLTLHADRLVRGGVTSPIESESDWARALDVHFGIVLER